MNLYVTRQSHSELKHRWRRNPKIFSFYSIIALPFCIFVGWIEHNGAYVMLSVKYTCMCVCVRVCACLCKSGLLLSPLLLPMLRFICRNCFTNISELFTNVGASTMLNTNCLCAWETWQTNYVKCISTLAFNYTIFIREWLFWFYSKSYQIPKYSKYAIFFIRFNFIQILKQ